MMWKRLSSLKGRLGRLLKGTPPPPKTAKKKKKTEGKDDFGIAARQLLSIAQTSGKVAGDKAPRVLMATGMGGYNNGSVTDSLLGLALKGRGARVDMLLCDSFLPGCQLAKFGNTPLETFERGEQSPRCGTCSGNGQKVFEATGLPVLKYTHLVSDDRRAEIRKLVADLKADDLGTYSPGGVKLGEHALAGALRYFARGELKAEPQGEIVLRRYLESAILTYEAMVKLLDENKYDVVVAHHGIYVPQGMVVAACHQRGVRVVTWNPAYRKHCFVFSHDDSYHHTMVGEDVGNWENLPWTDELDQDLSKYLKSRWYGTEDWIWFHSEPQHDIDAIAKEIGYDTSKPVVTLLSNVVWDAQLHYASNAFPNMMAWVANTIRYFAKRPELQLVIRVHPAEIRGFVPSRQLLIDEIKKEFEQLPPNIFVVPPESDVSTYALCDASNAVLIYNTKTGMEVTAQGIPTVVAGEAWIRGKGFAHDPRTPEQYFKVLDQLPFKGRLSAAQTLRARKYAYHIFFRRMIPMPLLKPLSTTTLELDVKTAEELAPGNYPGLDVICEGILKGTPFIHKAERAAQPRPATNPRAVEVTL